MFVPFIAAILLNLGLISYQKTSANRSNQILQVEEQLHRQDNFSRNLLPATNSIHDIIHVAFVFAGSVRSFVTPLIHQTIKQNLIQGFCPYDKCQHDVFVRVSLSDNNHVGMNSTGVLAASSSSRLEVDAALNILKPEVKEGGMLYLQYVDIGSREEFDEMILFAGDNLKHRIYRDLDPRRYSMYFNRWKAYEQVLHHEKIENKSYTWIIFARLDAGWGSPLPSFDHWSKDSIHVHETWFIDVPDTFAIIPRSAADVYFSMPSLMKPLVLCLGGPNFDPDTLTSSFLSNRGYNHTEIVYIQKEDCRVMFPQSQVVQEALFRKNWSGAGFSEKILRRRLMLHGYAQHKRNLKFVPLFMFITRYPLDLVCFFLESGKLLRSLTKHNTPSASLAPACHFLSHDIKCYNERTPLSKKQSICRPGLYIHSDVNHIAVSKLDSCLLDKRVSDTNFLPFRIRMASHCLTTQLSMDNDTTSMTSKNCIDYSHCTRGANKKVKEKYSPEQLFYFYPLIRDSQKIRQYTVIPNEKKLCLTAIIPSYMTAAGYQFKMNYDNTIIHITVKDCGFTDDQDFSSSQMFRILIHLTGSPTGTITTTLSNPRPAFLSPFPSTSDHMMSPYLKSCDINFNPASSKNEVVLERVNLYGEPYLLGETA